MFRTISVAVLIWASVVAPVMAADQETVNRPADSLVLPARSVLAPSSSVMAAFLATPMPVHVTPFQRGRPAGLIALYGGFVALEIFDGYTTFEAKKRGARETNPTLGEGNTATVWAVKAATTASTIFFVDRIGKKHRVAAMLLMVGVTSGYAAIVSHNARLAR